MAILACMAAIVRQRRTGMTSRLGVDTIVAPRWHTDIQMGAGVSVRHTATSHAAFTSRCRGTTIYCIHTRPLPRVSRPRAFRAGPLDCEPNRLGGRRRHGWTRPIDRPGFVWHHEVVDQVERPSCQHFPDKIAMLRDLRDLVGLYAKLSAGGCHFQHRATALAREHDPGNLVDKVLPVDEIRSDAGFRRHPFDPRDFG
jgi:hypothetical protein